MKFVFYSVRSRKNKKEKGYNVRGLRINFERLLFISFIVTFILLIFVQAALMSPSVRTFMSVNNGYEGVPLGPEEYLYKEGQLELETSETENAGELKILINGDEAAAFTSKNISINVKDGDVVEIDGSTVQESVEVGITSKSTNITSDCIGKRIRVKSNVKKLLKVKID